MISIELYLKCLNKRNNYNDMFVQLETDTLEYEVRLWEALLRTKPGEGDGILPELFEILKDDAVKGLHSICQQIWKTQQWPQDWKRSIFIPIPKKGSAKESLSNHTIQLEFHYLY